MTPLIGMFGVEGDCPAQGRRDPEPLIHRGRCCACIECHAGGEADARNKDGSNEQGGRWERRIGSDGIHLAYAAYFGPFLPHSNLHRSILSRFRQQCANCRVPLSRQVGNWCVICRRQANYRSMDSLGKRRGMADDMVFGPELAYMGTAWQPRRGSRLQVRLPPR